MKCMVWPVVAISLMLTSCVVIPLPTIPEPDPFGETKIADLQIGVAQPEDVYSQFGSPMVTREYGKLHIYRREVRAMHWIAGAMYAGDAGTVYKNRFMFLRYDNDNRLQEMHRITGVGNQIPDGTRIGMLPTGPTQGDRSYVKRKGVVVFASDAKDFEAKAFKTHPDYGVIYVTHRDDKVALFLDQEYIGRGADNGFYCFYLSPGSYSLRANLESELPHDINYISHPKSIQVTPGSITFLEATWKKPEKLELFGSNERIVEIIPRDEDSIVEEIKEKRLILDNRDLYVYPEIRETRMTSEKALD